MTFGDRIRSWTMVPRRMGPMGGGAASQTLKGSAPQTATQPPPQSVFASPQALTFPIAVVLIGGAWGALQLFGTHWSASLWLPFSASILVGALITFPSVYDDISREQKRAMQIFVAVRGSVIGLLNSMVLFGAVAGAGSAVSSLAGGQGNRPGVQAPAATAASPQNSSTSTP